MVSPPIILCGSADAHLTEKPKINSLAHTLRIFNNQYLLGVIIFKSSKQLFPDLHGNKRQPS